ncbi:MAG TPA: cadherin domain-containing protein [Trichocoleus sp.]
MPANPGNEFLVNSHTPLNQRTYAGGTSGTFFDSFGDGARSMRSIAMDANGNFVVAWSSVGQDNPAFDRQWGIYAQRFDKTGAPNGSSFLVNTIISFNQVAPSVAMNAAGDFAITWSSNAGSNQDDTNGYGVYTRFYSADGTAKTASETRVNTVTTANQFNSMIAMDADDDATSANDGGYVISWTSQNQDGDGNGVFAQRYDKNGAKAGSEITVNTLGGQITGAQQNSAIAMADDGSFVVVWESDQGSSQGDASGWGIFAQRFDALGNAQGSIISINQYTTGDQRLPSVAMKSDGSFVVAWTSVDQIAGGGQDIFYRRFDNQGNAIDSTDISANGISSTSPYGPDNTFVPGAQTDPIVSMSPNGDFLISWSSNDAAAPGVYVRRFSGSTGKPLSGGDGDLIHVNTALYGTASTPYSSVAASNNSFAAVWTVDSDGDQQGVVGRVYTIPDAANRAPTDLAITPAQVNENTATGTVVGTFGTTDPDSGNTFTYSFVTGTGDTDNGSFTIDNTTGQLKLNVVPDFETKSSYSIRVRTTDQGNLSFEKVLTIGIQNINEAPTDIALSANSVDENLPIGSVVGAFSTVDQDAGDSFTYSLVTGTGSTDNGLFTIDNTTGQLKLNVVPNFETKNSYSIRVRSRDQGGLTTEKVFAITVKNVNEAPSDITLSANNVDENQPIGTVVGTLSTADPDASSSFTYSLVTGTGSTDNSSFTIDPTTGQLKLNAIPDFETKSTYSIRVQSTDQGGLSTQKVFTINIKDVNETPTDVALSANRVDENVAIGTVVGTLSTTDPDAGDSFTYSLVTGTGSTDNSSFTIDSTTGQLKINVVPDFETQPTYSIRVKSADQAGLFTEKVLTIAVNNLNDAPQDISLSSTNVNENVPAGSLIGTFSTTDPDPSNTFTYSLTAGTGSTDNGLFTIDPATGQLKISASPNFETKNSYAIRVRSTDQDGKFFEKTFTVGVNDVNEIPTGLSLSPTNIQEGVAIGSIVGAFNTADPDTSDSFTYSLVSGTGSTDNSAFTIDPVTGQLKVNVVPDFETKPSYSIRVKTTDRGNNTFEKAFTITIDDQPDIPTDIGLSPSSVAENTAIGTVVGTLSSTDQDANDTFTYSLVTGTGSTDNSAFTIDPVTGELKLNVVPNYSNKSSYSIRVRTTDSTNLSYEKVLTVTVIDPNSTNRPPTDLSLSPTAINENSPTGSLIGTASTTDPNSGDSFTYSLVSGAGSTDNGLFTIDPTTGQLKANFVPDFETKSSYSIRVRTADQGNLTFEKSFTINVNNQPDAPTDISLSPSSVAENKAIGSVVGAFSSVDQDTGDTFTYSLVTGTGSTDNSAFTIDPTTGQLKLNVVPDFEGKPSYSIRVRTTDQTNRTFEKQFTVNITDQPEQPTDLSLSANTVNDGATVGSLVGTVTTADQDTGDSFTYSLVSGTGSTDNSAFTIDPATGQLKLNTTSDYSSQNSYSIRVKTTDSTNLSFEKVFTISVLDNSANRPPTNIGLSTNTVNETSPVGSLVGTFTTDDPNAGDSFTYSLVTGTGSTDNSAFTIDPTTGQLKLNVVPDFETKNSYAIRVRTTDQGNKFFEKAFTVNVNDLPEAPTNLTLTPNQVDENVTAGTIVGTLSSTDPDAAGSFTYSLVTGTGSTDNNAFTIDPTTGQLKINVVPNFEAKPTYSIRVQTKDSTGLIFEKALTVGIKNVNETPTNLSLSTTNVDEGVPSGTVVGGFATTDPDTGNTFTYSLVTGTGSTDNSAFTIDSTGQLKVNFVPDYNTKNSYAIRVRTTDQGGLFFEKQFTVNVVNLPDAPTDISLTPNQVDENVTTGTIVGTFGSVDPSGGTFTYSLVTGTGSTDNSAFTIDPTTGQLKINVVPNFEAKPSYSIRVQTKDDTGLTFEKALTVGIKDVNETPTDVSLISNSVNERVPVGTVVSGFSTTDPDTGNTFAYSLVTGAGSTDNSAFTIDPTTGQLKVNFVPDYNTKNSYAIRVRTTDQGGLFFEKQFTVNVVDLPDAPTDISLTPNQVDENVTAGTIVGTLSSTDPDAAGSFTYSLVTGTGSTDNSAFTIDPVTGQLKINVVPNFEAKPTYSIRVQTKDSTGLIFEKALTVGIKNVNETPTNLSLSTTNVDEGVPSGTVVGGFATTDPDTGNTFTYSLAAGTGSTDNSAFTIDPTTGQLKVNFVPDYNTKNSYAIRVRTTDQGGLFFEKQFTVNVVNLPDAPTDISLTPNQVNENVTTGTIVGTFGSVDPDGGSFLYSLVSGTGSTDNGLFTIDSAGQLKLNFVPDFETKNSYSIRVRTTDSTGLSIEKAFTIGIKDVNETPTDISLSPTSVNEASPIGTVVGTLGTTDPDSNDKFTYSLVAGTGNTDNSSFTIDPTTGQLKLNFVPDFETKNSYSIRVRTTDQGSLSFEKVFTVNITDKQETPTDLILAPSSINENVASGSLVGTLSTVDPDRGDVFTYSLVTGTGSNDNNLFTVDSQTGQLKVNFVPDFETKPTYSIRVRTTDSAGLFFEKALTVNIANLNEPPNSLTLSSTAIDEEVPANTLVGTISANDPEGGNLTYSLVQGFGDNAAFTINGNRLLINSSPDYEAKSAYSIQIAVTDAGGLSQIKNFAINVRNVNEAPTVSTTSGSVSYTENAAAITIDPTLNLSDPDSTNLTQATVSIQGYNNQQDQLSFTSPTGSGISGSFNATTGILTLQGTATLAAYQAALRSVVYKNLSDAPSATPRAIRFSVNDGSLTSNTAVRTVQIIPVNDVPVVTPSVSSLTVTAGERVTPLDPNLSVTDVDNTQLAGVTVTLNGYIAKEDTLLFSDQSGIVGSFNAINGVLTLSGNASVAAYQTALRSILYLNSSDRPTTTPRLITISANDGSSSSDPNAAQIPIQFKEVTAVPVIDLNGGGAGNDFSNTFVIAGPAVAVTSTEARLTDTGSSVLTAAQVKISNLFDPQNEELQVDPSGTGISTSYDRTTGTLTLTGAAPLSSYLNVLRSIKYQNHAANPDRTTRVILFSVSDGTGRSEPAQTTIQMTDMKLNDGTDGNDQMITTPAIDRIHALGGDDKVTSILANLQQNDVIDGGGGKDTFVLTDGTGSALIDITNPVNQISGIFTNNTTIANFENFDFAGFQGNVTLIGSNDSNTVISGAGGDNLSGGAGDDRLVSNAGSDRLDGGLGNDVLEGGLGDDLYIVDSPNDQVIEGLNAGFDIISASTSYTLPNHVEELDLTGFAVVGTGNALDNTIVGNDANNLLNGNLGADLLIGNAGNDSLWGDNGDDELIGGTGNDTLVGGDGNDRLDGGQGRDRLTGGTGKDTFVLSSSQKQSRDVITDFNSKDDTIVISRSSFSSRLKRGKVRANAFALGNHAFDTKDRFIYNSKTGSLFFDIDGIGGAKQVQIAQVSRNATLNRSDIVVMP